MSQQEQRALKKFVRSPAFNKREDVIALFDYLYRIDPAEYTSLRKERAFKAVFPKQPYDSDQMDYTMSFLLKCIENFLVEQRTSQAPQRYQIALVQEYRRLGLEKHFSQALRRARRLHQKHPHRDTRYHRYDFRLEVEQYEFESEKQRSQPTNLQALNDKLDIQYIAQKLRNSCLTIAHQSVFKTTYKTGLLDFVVQYIEQTPRLLEFPAISLYYYYYKALKAPEKGTFFKKFKAILLEQTDHFAHSEMRDLYLLAINYCVKKSNEGDKSYYNELFDLFKVGIEKEILMDNEGTLHHFTFKNAVRLAIRLQKLDWAKHLVKNYQSYLMPQQKAAYVSYAQAEILMAEEAYEEAMMRLQQVDYTDLLMSLGAKTMLIKIYYELGEFDVLDSFLSSFQTFIRRKKVLGYHRDNYKNIIKFTQKLLNTSPYNQRAKDQLHQQIEEAQPLTEKAWLLEQLADI